MTKPNLRLVKRFDKRQRRLFDAAMKLVLVKGAVTRTESHANPIRHILRADWRGASLAIAMHVTNIVDERRCILISISEPVPGSLGWRFQAEIVMAKEAGEIRKYENAYGDHPGNWEAAVLRKGARLSLRHRNLLRENPGY
jgi:hypothetical protein